MRLQKAPPQGPIVGPSVISRMKRALERISGRPRRRPLRADFISRQRVRPRPRRAFNDLCPLSGARNLRRTEYVKGSNSPAFKGFTRGYSRADQRPESPLSCPGTIFKTRALDTALPGTQPTTYPLSFYVICAVPTPISSPQGCGSVYRACSRRDLIIAGSNRANTRVLMHAQFNL